jgi:STIP1 homology and U-box containing protein 1
MTRLKMAAYEGVIEDCLQALKLNPEMMKGHYYLAQAQLGVNHPSEAHASALRAYRICLDTNDRSVTNVNQLVLNSKQASWALREKTRLREQNTLLEELKGGLIKERDQRVAGIREEIAKGTLLFEEEEEVNFAFEATNKKIETLERVFNAASEPSFKKREVPEWAIDNITFAVMHDPIVVCL